MTSMARIFKEKRTLIVPVAILAIANIAALLLVVYPLSVSVSSTEGRAVDAKVRLAKATAEFNEARATLDGRARTDKQLARFYAEILPTDQAAARRITYLKLAKLARDENLVWDHRTFKPEEPKKESTLTRMNMAIELRGRYREMRQFIHALEVSPEFIVINGVTLAQGRDQDDKSSLSLTMQMTTYYRAGDEQQ
jgi:Tfp pilus assembly protein PilO